MTASLPTIHQPESTPPLQKWHPATWEEYLALRDAPSKERMKLIVNQAWLWIDMSGEGINHASVSDLFDLDEQKLLYAALKIPEYWVIDVRGRRVFAFQLQENGEYKACTRSSALAGLPISLLEQTLEQLPGGSNTAAAAWFAQQIASLSA
jgi:Uma2 family endonuclease